MFKKNGSASLAIACISLLLSIVCLGMLLGQGQPAASSSDAADNTKAQYVMYVGTNDKDTYKAEVSSEEAKKIVDETCLKYFEGYTLQEARGAWTDGKNNLTHEYTLVCYFDDADINMVHKAADELITKLNQNSILIEKDMIEMEFYSNSN